MQHAKSVRQARDSVIIDFPQPSQEKIDLILSLDACELREHLIKGSFTSVELVNVFG